MLCWECGGADASVRGLSGGLSSEGRQNASASMAVMAELDERCGLDASM